MMMNRIENEMNISIHFYLFSSKILILKKLLKNKKYKSLGKRYRELNIKLKWLNTLYLYHYL